MQSMTEDHLEQYWQGLCLTIYAGNPEAVRSFHLLLCDFPPKIAVRLEPTSKDPSISPVKSVLTITVRVTQIKDVDGLP